MRRVAAPLLLWSKPQETQVLLRSLVWGPISATTIPWSTRKQGLSAKTKSPYFVFNVNFAIKPLSTSSCQFVDSVHLLLLQCLCTVYRISPEPFPAFRCSETRISSKGEAGRAGDMSKVRVAGFGLALDGYGAGAEQSFNDPLGKRGAEIFQWFFHTKTFRAMHGQEGGSTDLDDMFARRSMENFGAFILGRNMFGPVRGQWPDNSWKGWWGDNPPYHAPTFVLTHYDREPLVMEGGTTFHFVTRDIEEALRLAKQAAGDKDVKIGGGVSTVRQYLQAGLIDSVHLAMAPVLLGKGEALFSGLDLPALGFSITERKASEHATHIVLEKR